MKNKNIISVIATVVAPILTHGVTIELSSLSGFPPSQTLFFDSDLSPMSVGNVVRLGSFDTGGLADSEYFSANLNDLSVLSSDFIIFGNDFQFDSSGGFSGSTARGNLNVENTPLENQKIYLWAFSTIDDTSNLGTDFDNVSGYGIFSSTLSKWNFGQNDDPTSVITLRNAEIDQFLVADGNGLNLVAAAVPEPSTYATICGALVLGLALYRRRNNK